MGLTDDDVREILRIIDESDVDELLIESRGFSLHVLRGTAGEGALSGAAQPARAAPESAPSPSAPADAADSAPPARSSEDAAGAAPAARSSGDAAGAAPAARSSEGAAGAAPAAEATEDGLVVIESPMLGTFYRAESPGAPPFVEVGSRVEPDTTVCIIEVMKMMNSVPAGVSGTISEIVADNAALVEYGAPLFRVRADGTES